jgi:hypothetical protein
MPIIRTKARYRNQTLELEVPLDLPNGTEVDVEITPTDAAQEQDQDTWGQIGMSRLEEEWDNTQDSIYDDWKKLYGV